MAQKGSSMRWISPKNVNWHSVFGVNLWGSSRLCRLSLALAGRSTLNVREMPRWMSCPCNGMSKTGGIGNAACGACNQHSTRSLAATADIQSNFAVSSARADFTLAVTARSATFVQLCVGTHENRRR